MYHPLWSRRANHRFAVDAINPEPRLVPQFLTQLPKSFLRVASAEVHRVHPSPFRTAKRSVLEVMIENYNIAGIRLQNERRDFRTGHPPDLSTLADIAFDNVGIRLANAVAAGDNSECAGIMGQRVKVESDLDTHKPISVVTVRVPAGVPSVEIAISTCIVKIIPTDTGGDVMDTRVV